MKTSLIPTIVSGALGAIAIVASGALFVQRMTTAGDHRANPSIVVVATMHEFAQRIAAGGALRRALTVPTAAVRQSAVGSFVWRRRDGRLERVVVTVGAQEADVSEVRSGLVAGDSVVTNGFPDPP